MRASDVCMWPETRCCVLTSKEERKEGQGRNFGKEGIFEGRKEGNTEVMSGCM